MNKIKTNFQIILLCTSVWIILNERFSFLQIVIGSLLGFLAIIITDEYLLMQNYNRVYQIRIFSQIKYFLFLIKEIYIAGIMTIPKIITRNINPEIVKIHTKIHSDLQICILANSITLTPGTVTIDKKKQTLTVLWLNCVSKDSEKAGEMIKGKLERMLLKG